MRIKVLFFATFRDLAGTRETIVELPEEPAVKDFKSHLQIKFPGLSTTLNNLGFGLLQPIMKNNVNM